MGCIVIGWVYVANMGCIVIGWVYVANMGCIVYFIGQMLLNEYSSKYGMYSYWMSICSKYGMYSYWMSIGSKYGMYTNFIEWVYLMIIVIVIEWVYVANMGCILECYWMSISM